MTTHNNWNYFWINFREILVGGFWLPKLIQNSIPNTFLRGVLIWVCKKYFFNYKINTLPRGYWFFLKGRYSIYELVRILNFIIVFFFFFCFSYFCFFVFVFFFKTKSRAKCRYIGDLLILGDISKNTLYQNYVLSDFLYNSYCFSLISKRQYHVIMYFIKASLKAISAQLRGCPGFENFSIACFCRGKSFWTVPINIQHIFCKSEKAWQNMWFGHNLQYSM